MQSFVSFMQSFELLMRSNVYYGRSIATCARTTPAHHRHSGTCVLVCCAELNLIVRISAARSFHCKHFSIVSTLLLSSSLFYWNIQIKIVILTVLWMLVVGKHLPIWAGVSLFMHAQCRATHAPDALCCRCQQQQQQWLQLLPQWLHVVARHNSMGQMRLARYSPWNMVLFFTHIHTHMHRVWVKGPARILANTSRRLASCCWYDRSQGASHKTTHLV